ncbi:SIMPL domain-containing protein [Candidatus Finniella inopinata]|uniref:SIMPL domain-containing protein n=1 Tax=Candidatus Finniella inopinata TaxID=1696036 RepID=A0A4V2DZW6_9PROT|nr:SIMPL domain-containing protein [Candidatus Finniella inopinata]RZI46487.1 SIMPL domain-containing protein [Candidatus Finniella inopinata]
MNNIKPLMVLLVATVIALGTALSGFFIGRSIEKFKTSDRAIVVKGFSEREVKSDIGDLTLTVKNPGNDLAEMKKKSDQDTKIVIAFLKSKGIKEEEITPGGAELTDRKVDNYFSVNDKLEYRYVLTTRIKVTTPKVEVIRDIGNQTAELINQQVIVGSSTRYYFTRFADLRTEMIAEATQSARQAALQFAKDSGSRVGEIRNAVQGAFSITSPNEEFNEAGSLEKKVRVVTTVTFNLVD